jgi:2-dehydro-3-deoxyphosphogluconate aldolase / (4S)-4-hydroxy-2-oxoglutarate aldolase
MLTLEQQLKTIKVVPVITLHDVKLALPLAKTLMENDLPCAEITFRTDAAAAAIRVMRDAYPDMLIGAGTVLTTAQVDQAIDAGADFIVSPGLNPTTVRYCQQRGITIIPGINNPSLVEQALSLDLKTVKFFPAEPSGGLAMLKALSAVYPVAFMPTGGIDSNNIKAYLAVPTVLACGGTWMVPASLLEAEDWAAIAALIRSITL